MTIKITLFITMIIYAMVISQSLFYMLGLSKVLRSMHPATYNESTQLLQQTTGQTISFIHYLALIACIALTEFCVTNPSGILFASSLVALSSLVIDVLLPANSYIINNKPGSLLMRLRHAISLIGFVALLAGMILSI